MTAQSAYLIEEVVPTHFLGRGETGLPESCFQSMFCLYINDKEVSGAAELSAIRAIAEAVYGITGLAVKETVFSGFESA